MHVTLPNVNKKSCNVQFSDFLMTSEKSYLVGQCVCVCDMYKFDDFFLQKLKYLTCWNVYSVLIILATVTP